MRFVRLATLVVTAIWLTLWTCCCASAASEPGAIPGPGTKPQGVTLVFHGDTDFTMGERALILAAREIWLRQTDGLANITVTFDLDFHDAQGLGKLTRDKANFMIRYTSDLDAVKATDSFFKASVLGWASLGNGRWTVGLIVDRYPNGAYGLQVMVHEMGHTLGLDHINDEKSIMNPYLVPKAAVCLRKPELDQFCTLYECGGYNVRPCKGE